MMTMLSRSKGISKSEKPRERLPRGHSNRKALEMAATAIHRKPVETSDADADDFVVGSGNYLADRGYADPEETRLKFLMCNQIAVIADQRGWTQSKVAEVTGLAQSDVSRIVNGNVKDYSVWRLMRALNNLG